MTETRERAEPAWHAPAQPPQPHPDEITDFALDLLAELRASNYRPAGWLRFLGRSWRQSRRAAKANPRLVASWAGVTVALGLSEAAVFALEGLLDDPQTARRAIPGAALVLASAQCDAYVHLGMNHPQRGDPLHTDLGLPTALTLARRAMSGLLFGHLLCGKPANRLLALTLLLGSAATDIGDGAVARRTGRVTRLGAYLDGIADFEFTLALVLTLSARRLLPRWLVTSLLARWIAPFAVVLARYFGWVSRVRIGSTGAGKAVGVAQFLTLGAALLGTGDQPKRRGAVKRLHLVTAALLLLAPLAQLRRMFPDGRGKLSP
ncbi:MAG TPA: CDP-alcohol phosphatidyltransferase family protein [Ktedonobacterales bacterium]|nr:CDP-alcohol phosphatidyltransferase family protein [Ktedonobacterales bacterium]